MKSPVSFIYELFMIVDVFLGPQINSGTLVKPYVLEVHL